MRFFSMLSYLSCVLGIFCVLDHQVAEAEPNLSRTVPTYMKENNGSYAKAAQSPLSVRYLPFSTPESKDLNAHALNTTTSSVPLPGWIFQVSRSSSMEGAEDYDNGDMVPFRLFQQVVFEEEIIKSAEGRILDERRKTKSAKLYYLDQQSCHIIQEELVPKGTVFRLVQSRNGPILFNETSGQYMVDEYLKSTFSLALIPRLWPSTRLHIGQSWVYKGNDLVNRIGLLDIEDGYIDLHVQNMQPDPATGLQTAYIKGQLKSKMELDGIIFDFDANVAVDLPVAVGVPYIVNFDGTLSGSESFQADDGQVVGYQIKAQGVVLQIAKPAQNIIDQLAEIPGKDTSESSRKNPGQQEFLKLSDF